MYHGNRGFTLTIAVVMQDYAAVALLSAASVYLTNISLHSVPYTIKIVVKSCRVLPVMASAVVLQGKRYTAWELISACIMATGVFLFFAGEWHETQQGRKEWVGPSLLVVSLLLDAVVVNWEETRFFRRAVPASRAEVVTYLSGFSCVYTLAALAASGALSFLVIAQLRNWQKGMGKLMSASCCTALGCGGGKLGRSEILHESGASQQSRACCLSQRLQ
jgi:drug/metabolite transporter (DMT)-like permease